MIWKCRLALLAIAVMAPPPAGAQTNDRQLGEAMLTTRSVAQPATPRSPCRNGGEGKSDSGDIVVCGSNDEGQRIQSTGESDPGSRAGLRTGELHAPQFGKGSCRGMLGCLVGGSGLPPAYIIDMKAIPEAPAGSDADRVAKGELAER